VLPPMNSRKDIGFFVRRRGLVQGPFVLSEITKMVESGELSLASEISRKGSWITLRELFREVESDGSKNGFGSM